MAFLFGRARQRSHTDVVKSTKDLLQRLLKDDPQTQKVERSMCEISTATAKALDRSKKSSHEILR